LRQLLARIQPASTTPVATGHIAANDKSVY
jgi:hypothetical protein